MLKNFYKQLNVIIEKVMETNKTYVPLITNSGFRCLKVLQARILSDTCLPSLKFSCRLLLTICSLLLIIGCGYAVHGTADLPFRSVTIGKIINKTVEPKLEDRMHAALADELIKSGFSIGGGADHRIEGMITAFELKTLAEKSGVAVQFEVAIKGEFKLLDASGKARALRKQGVFIVSFLSAESLQNIIALKEKATEKAVKDLSSEIVASIIFD